MFSTIFCLRGIFLARKQWSRLFKDEFQLIDWIKKKTGKAPAGWTGIGDDAAVIGGRTQWIVSTDTIVESVDFDSQVTPEQAGRKALAVNLSDMAAMGAVPKAFLMTL